MKVCPYCKAEKARSRLTPDTMVSATCMLGSPGYYDEAGEWVTGYDPNYYTRGYSCSRGHYFTVTQHEGDPDEVKFVRSFTVHVVAP
jgi:hypothetical protein